MASIAPAPPRISSSVRAPSAGSVRFWVATAPISCAAKMHRAPTAGDDGDDRRPEHAGAPVARDEREGHARPAPSARPRNTVPATGVS